MTELLTAYPSRADRRHATCRNCTEALVREGRSKQAADFHHVSNGLNRCPDHAQPRQDAESVDQ